MHSILFALIGCFLGFLGLIPGAHINTILEIIALFGLDSNFLLALILPLSTSILFFSFVPAIFLNAPNEENALALLPGQSIMMQGNGYQAVELLVIGAVLSTILSIFLLPIYTFYSIAISSVLSVIVLPVLFLVSIITIFKSSYKKNLFFFVFSGILGFVSLSLSSRNIFPLLCGLFGTSSILTSLLSKGKVPAQIPRPTEMQIHRELKTSFLATIAGSLISIFPAISTSLAILFVEKFSKLRRKESLIAIGGTSAVATIYSLFSLALIGKSRSGLAVLVNKLLPNVTVADLISQIPLLLLGTGFGAFFTLVIAKRAHKYIARINYQKLQIGTLMSIFILVAVLLSIQGLIVLITSTSLGLIANLTNARKSNCMGSLVIPTVLFYL
jgi:putative membrane protein